MRNDRPLSVTAFFSAADSLGPDLGALAEGLGGAKIDESTYRGETGIEFRWSDSSGAGQFLRELRRRRIPTIVSEGE